MLALSLAACSTGGYWLPPSSLEHSQASLQPGTLPTLVGAKGTAEATPGPILLTPAPPTLALPTPEPPTEAPPTATPEAALPVLPAEPSATPEISTVNSAPYLYYAQAADTLPVVAVRFGVEPAEISSPDPLEQTKFLNPGQLLVIPRRLANTTSSQHLLPDSEIVFSPSAVDFDIGAYVQQAGGELSTTSQWQRSVGETSGAQIVLRVALENSINPRLLLALLEYHTGWVTGQVFGTALDYPMGHVEGKEKGLYNQLVWAVNQLSIGYYAYREGRLTQINFPDGSFTRLAPDLNAGTAALQYYFAQHYQGQAWLDALNPDTGFPALHASMFGNAWERAQQVEPLYPTGINQPPLILPFTRDWQWSFTGGPHGAWEHDGAYAALDFAPGSTQSGCVKSNAWVTAAAAGLVVRSGNGLLVLDLDGDGREQTGWVLVYLHVSNKDRVPTGTWLSAGDPLGHPSCEGGISTGTHLHLARKFNGEWVPAAGPLPFDLGGWVAQAGAAAYKGTLIRDDVIITACTCSSADTFIGRGPNDP